MRWSSADARHLVTDVGSLLQRLLHPPSVLRMPNVWDGEASEAKSCAHMPCQRTHVRTTVRRGNRERRTTRGGRCRWKANVFTTPTRLFVRVATIGWNSAKRYSHIGIPNT